MSSSQQPIARMCGKKSKWDSLNVSLAVLMLCLRGKGNALHCQVPDIYLCYILTTTNTEYISLKICSNKMTILIQTNLQQYSYKQMDEQKRSDNSTTIRDKTKWSLIVTDG